MSIISNTVTGARLAANRLSRLASNRFFQGFTAVLLVGALLSPLFVPLLHAILLAIAAAAALMALSYPALKSVRNGLGRIFGGIIPGSSSRSGKSLSGKSQVKNVSDGRATGNTIVDALADKLRKSGLKVSTDWSEGEKILKTLPEKYGHLKKDKDSLRGFVYQGVIFLNPSNVDESVPIHEFTHVWAEALRQKNPEEWSHIVGLLKKETALWEEVRQNYPHLTTEDEIADEVLATYSGRYGMEKLSHYYSDGTKTDQAFENLRKALEIFWKEVSKFFKCHFDTVESVSDRVLYDLFSGVNPERYIDENKRTLADEKPLASAVRASSPVQSDTKDLGSSVEPVSKTQQKLEIYSVAREYALGKGLRSSEEWLSSTFEENFGHAGDLKGNDYGGDRRLFAQNVLDTLKDSLSSEQYSRLEDKLMAIASRPEEESRQNGLKL